MPSFEYPHSGRGSPYRDRRGTQDPFQDPLPSPRLGESKQSPNRRPAVGHRSQNPQTAMMEALQDVVTVKPPIRAKPTRSTTATGTITSPSSSRPRPPQRTMTTDSIDKTVRATPPPAKPVKKKSTHVDLIDQLDYSGLGGGTFHHDGPFDALAPSRNRNGQKAPMSAFNDADQLDDPTAPDPAQIHKRKNSDSPYAIATAYIGTTGVNQFTEPPKSPVKSALAVAWGRADPEPFEEFSAGGYSAAPSTYAQSLETVEDDVTSGKSRGREDVAARNARRNTRIAPPPQPIMLPGSVTDSGFEPHSASPPVSPGTAKRSRSIMNRFRRTRGDSTSVPIPRRERDDNVSSPESQNGASWDGQLPSPNTPDEYVIIDNGRPITVVYSKDRPAGTTDYRSRAPLTQKALPDPPAGDDYFTRSSLEDGGQATSPGTGLGRKTSLYKKVKGLGAKVASR